MNISCEFPKFVNGSLNVIRMIIGRDATWAAWQFFSGVFELDNGQNELL
jgi:hypothetical protein